MSTTWRWLAVVAVIGALVPSVAWAQNFYGAVRGGPSTTTDARHPSFFGGEDETEFKRGFTAGAAVGYKFPFGLRAEGELGYLYVPLERDGRVEVDGSVKSYLLMANAYYDVKLPFLGPFRPYVGGGLGAARVNNDHQVFIETSSVAQFGIPGPVFPIGVKIDVDEWRTAFAYQARGGLLWEVNALFDLSLGYRYVHIDGGHVEHAIGKLHVAPINNHSVELGFAIKF
jgi:opacity protein-like surface antigen